jgi:hypothetical protein
MSTDKYPIAGLVPKSGTYMVTPEAATAWLGRNTQNRHMSVGRVAALAEELTEGRWMLTHQGIAFAKSGALLDGQHRLAAIAKSGVVVPMSVTCGLDESARLVIDTGRHRSAADTLGIMGHARCTLVASIAAIENRVRRGDSGCSTPTSLVVQMLAEHLDIDDAAEAVSARKGAIAGWLRQSVLGWWYWRAVRANRDKAMVFLDQVAIGESLRAGDPALAFRQRMSAVYRSSAPRVSQSESLFMLCSAWDSYCRGKKHLRSLPSRDGLPLTKLYGPGMQGWAK